MHARRYDFENDPEMIIFAARKHINQTETFIVVVTGNLEGGNYVTIKLGARDLAGNEIVSDIVTQSIRVYDSPSIYWDTDVREFMYMYDYEWFDDYILAEDEYGEWLDVTFEIINNNLTICSKILEITKGTIFSLP